ncbi:hypothetical protein, partial [Bilophila wadsworthia]
KKQATPLRGIFLPHYRIHGIDIIFMKNSDNRASESALAELHGVVAKLLTSRLQSGDASTADINAAIKFLKDNGIDCAGSANPDVQDLVANLPTFEDVSKDEVSLLN